MPPKLTNESDPARHHLYICRKRGKMDIQALEKLFIDIKKDDETNEQKELIKKDEK